MMREKDDFDMEQEIEITQKCDSETLFDLFGGLMHQELQDTSFWESNLTPEMQRFADRVYVSNARLEEIDLAGADGVSFLSSFSALLQPVPNDPQQMPPH